MGLKDRLLQFIGYTGLDIAAFERSVGLSNGAVHKMGEGTRASTIDKISETYPTLNAAWLKTGVGEMLISEERKNKTIESSGYSIVENKKSEIIRDIDYKLVPIIHIDSVGGVHSPNTIVGEPQYIEGYAPFTNAKDGDICIIQSGNSMTPTCPSGSLLLLREVSNWRDFFGYGNIFVIELSDGRRITKEVSRYNENPKDYIWCISHNPNVPDEELPKSIIVSVWKVIKIQIDKGW